MTERSLKVIIGGKEFDLTPEQFVQVYMFIDLVVRKDGPGCGGPHEDTATSTDQGAASTSSPSARARPIEPSADMGETESAVPVAESLDTSSPKGNSFGIERLIESTLSGFKRSESLLIKEEKPDVAFGIFRSLIKGKCINCPDGSSFPCETLDCRSCTMNCPCKTCEQERPEGLCITRMEPGRVRVTYNLQVTPIYWMSRGGGNNSSLDPMNLGKMAYVMNEFMVKSHNPVLLLEGMEYLIHNSGFDSVLKFIDDINEAVMSNKARFILPISPTTLEEKQLSKLERFMKIMQVMV
jgi:hypothetical protein